MEERTTFFDPDRRQMKILSSRLIGKLEPGQTDLSQMVETDKIDSRNKKKAATDVVQPLDGLTDTCLSECVTERKPSFPWDSQCKRCRWGFLPATINNTQ